MIKSYFVLLCLSRDLILQCLDDRDESIRYRALDLIVGMVRMFSKSFKAFCIVELCNSCKMQSSEKPLHNLRTILITNALSSLVNFIVAMEITANALCLVPLQVHSFPSIVVT